MSGALLATLGVATAQGGSGGHPNAMAWNNAFGQIAAATNSLTVAGLSGAKATITATLTGTGQLSYLLNGVITKYTGGFLVSDGDTIEWLVFIGVGGPTSGTVTVKSAGGTFTVGTFTYVVTSLNFGFIP